MWLRARPTGLTMANTTNHHRGGNGKTATWNVIKARELYDQGVAYAEIAEQCGITKSALHGYSNRHWPSRAVADESLAKRFLGGHKPKKGAKELDFAKERQQKAKAQPIAPGGSTLPPLPSLTYLD